MRKEIEYPNYNSGKTDGDWAILVLDEAAPSNQPLVRPNSQDSYPPVGEQLTVMGYGDTNPSDYVSDLSDKLKKVNVNAISNADCDDSSDGRDDYYNQISDNMLCANVNGGGKDACQVRIVCSCFYFCYLLSNFTHIFSLYFPPPKTTGRLWWSPHRYQWQRTSCPSGSCVMGDRVRRVSLPRCICKSI